jgi:brefeldin A-resistance guanine nucleotide exchange factor 1
MVSALETSLVAPLMVPAWNAFWLPPLLVISKQCVNTARPLRQRATTHLQRLLLSPNLLSPSSPASPAQILPTVFDRVLFPVLDELLKPQVYERDPSGMGETRLKSATLLCKVFLQYVVRLAEGVEGEGEVVGGVFVKVLDKLERFMRGERDLLVRSVTLAPSTATIVTDEISRTKLVNR